MTMLAGTKGTRLRATIAAIGVLALSGCLSPSQAQSRWAAPSLDQGAYKNYCNVLSADTRLAPLKNKVPFFAEQVSLRHMAIEKYAGPAEKKALFVLAENWKKCQKAYRNFCVRYHPLAVGPIDEYIVDTERAILSAVKRQISLGRLNELRSRAKVIHDRQVADAESRYRAARRRDWERRQNQTKRCRWVGDVWTCRRGPRPPPRVCCYKRDGPFRRFWVTFHSRCKRQGGRIVRWHYCRR